MTNKVTRADRMLDTLSRTGLSPQGADFLRAALDPMHDTQLKELQGWPDLETASSVNLAVKQSITISQTGNVNWDMYIVQFPWFDGMPMVGATRTNNLLYPSTTILPASTVSLGGCCVWIVAQGAQLDLSVRPDYMLNIPSAYSQGGLRVIGAGFEVVNTTAEIYKQGQLCVWRQPNGCMEPSQFQARYGNSGGGAIAMVPLSGTLIASPPINFQSAMLIPGTRQWKAGDGCYVVTPHLSAENPQVLVQYDSPVVHLTQQADGTLNVQNPVTLLPAANNISNVLMPVQGNGTISGTYFSQATRIFPLHQTGAILTGLSPQSTLTLTLNLYLERFPTVSEPEILVLATPSAKLDPLALQIYSEALMSLPVGVPANENGLGDWFAGVVKKVTDFLTPAAAATGFPLVAAASGVANRMANSYLAPPSPMVRPPIARQPRLNRAQQRLVAPAPKPRPPQKKKKPTTTTVVKTIKR